jgi:hypothetical protein
MISWLAHINLLVVHHNICEFDMVQIKNFPFMLYSFLPVLHSTSVNPFPQPIRHREYMFNDLSWISMISRILASAALDIGQPFPPTHPPP